MQPYVLFYQTSKKQKQNKFAIINPELQMWAFVAV